MISFYLFLIDLFVPLVLSLSFHFIYDGSINLDHVLLSISFSLGIVLLSIVKGYYNDYYLVHFSEKIKISFSTWFFAIFIQLIMLNYLLFEINLLIFFTWILIPIILLIAKYIIKKKSKHFVKSNIHLIGTFYTFNEHEIRTLENKGFLIFYHDGLSLKLRNSIKANSLLVLNLPNTEVDAINIDHYLDANVINLDDFFEKYLRKVNITSDYSYIFPKSYDRPSYFAKRAIDLIAILVFLPILILLIFYTFFMKKKHKISDSIFFKQKRYGLNKSNFNIIKLRTMHEDSEMFGNTKKSDPRVYSYAKTIRNLRLDELPQLLNIIFGDMHLVGPRAEWIKLADSYEKNIDHYHLRHAVRPGITGWAQIIYPYGVDLTDARQKFMYDLYYIKYWSIWLEIEICFKTFLVILDKSGF